jgi:hypothetical protein
MKLKQCLLRRNNEETTAWIEERGARNGALVELLLRNGKSEFWTVAEVYDFAMEQAVLEGHNRLNRGSLPSIVP